MNETKILHEQSKSRISQNTSTPSEMIIEQIDMLNKKLINKQKHRVLHDIEKYRRLYRMLASAQSDIFNSLGQQNDTQKTNDQAQEDGSQTIDDQVII